MMIFSSLDTAIKEGFHWLEYRADLGVHLVERVFIRVDGQLTRALALAKAERIPEPASSASR
ncbi:MAG: hypothetical protein AB7S38_19365 [Vulcanimicrobiota bacterium]